MQEENSISIINRSNGAITGEHAQFIPVKISTSLSWVKIFIAGIVVTVLILGGLLFTAQTQVAAVQVTGKADTYQILQIN